jgi:hypothetical protein
LWQQKDVKPGNNFELSRGAVRQALARMHCRMYARSRACLKPLAVASLRHAARFTTAGILVAKQLCRNLARSLPLRFWVFACCRQASRAALTSSRDGRRTAAGAAGADVDGRGVGEGGDAGNGGDAGSGADEGGVAGDGAGVSNAAGGSVAGCAVAGRSMAWFANANAASMTATIPMRFMTDASPITAAVAPTSDLWSSKAH